MVDHRGIRSVISRASRLLKPRNALEPRSLIADAPTILTIETSSVCNLRCVMCPHAIGRVKRPKHLNDELAKKLSGFIAAASDIQLHGIGEPLLSPAFWNLLKTLPPGRNSTINTNLTRLTEAEARTLGNSNLALINVSLDAATEETYRFIRGYDLKTVLKNFDLLRRHTRPNLVLALNMTIMRSNYAEIPMLVELAASRGAEQVCLWHLNRWEPSIAAEYEIPRGDRHFSYRSEGMWDELDAVRPQIAKAQEVAERLGIELELDHNKDI